MQPTRSTPARVRPRTGRLVLALAAVLTAAPLSIGVAAPARDPWPGPTGFYPLGAFGYDGRVLFPRSPNSRRGPEGIKIRQLAKSPALFRKGTAPEAQPGLFFPTVPNPRNLALTGSSGASQVDTVRENAVNPDANRQGNDLQRFGPSVTHVASAASSSTPQWAPLTTAWQIQRYAVSFPPHQTPWRPVIPGR